MSVEVSAVWREHAAVKDFAGEIMVHNGLFSWAWASGVWHAISEDMREMERGGDRVMSVGLRQDQRCIRINIGTIILEDLRESPCDTNGAVVNSSLGNDIFMHDFDKSCSNPTTRSRFNGCEYSSFQQILRLTQHNEQKMLMHIVYVTVSMRQTTKAKGLVDDSILARQAVCPETNYCEILLYTSVHIIESSRLATTPTRGRLLGFRALLTGKSVSVDKGDVTAVEERQ